MLIRRELTAELLPQLQRMRHLTELEKQFLAHHKIPLSRVFDATGLARREYSNIMRREDKYFAVGASECLNGHTLRTRSGNCIQCRPASIAFELRRYAPAYVYIAGSTASKLIKVGSSKDPTDRLYIANLDGYAGASDWNILFFVHVGQAGAVESEVQSRLRTYKKKIRFNRNGVEQEASECFSCNYSEAHSNLCLSLVDVGIFDARRWQADQSTIGRYEFNYL
jgi:hypothetical protein